MKERFGLNTIFVLLAIIIGWIYISLKKSSENMNDVPKFYTSGASMRVLAQKFSSADQAVVTVQDDSNNKKAVVLTAQNGIINPDLSGYVGTGDAHMYTSGASMRVLDQVFSSTDQAPSVAVHSIDDPNMPPLYLRAALMGR
jgi:hypothetical protein